MDVISYLLGKKAGGGGEPVTVKYAPKYLCFQQYTGNNLDYETNNLDTSNMTTMESMFAFCREITSLNLSGFKTNNIINMSALFSGCSKLETLDLSGWKTNNVAKMSNMFNGCQKLSVLNINHFNTSNVTDMESMFYNCGGIIQFNLNNFDTSNVETMRNMFANCVKVEPTINLSNFKGTKTTTTTGMFTYDSKVQSIDLSNFDTPLLKEISSMFLGCRNLRFLDIRKMTFDLVTQYANAFNSVPTDCEIIVKSDTEKAWLQDKFPTLTNIKTVAEYET